MSASKRHGKIVLQMVVRRDCILADEAPDVKPIGPNLLDLEVAAVMFSDKMYHVFTHDVH